MPRMHSYSIYVPLPVKLHTIVYMMVVGSTVYAKLPPSPLHTRYI